VYLQQNLGEVVRGWLHDHPCGKTACRLGSEDGYIAGAFERFWQLAIEQQLEFSTLDAALLYLRVSLHAAVLDTLRTSSQLKELTWSSSYCAREISREDALSCAELWELLQGELSNGREQRLAYLLFHCGLKPREIAHCRPLEFGDVCEIYRLRRNIMERLSRNDDLMRQLS
jgi:hypothetical protein